MLAETDEALSKARADIRAAEVQLCQRRVVPQHLHGLEEADLDALAPDGRGAPPLGHEPRADVLEEEEERRETGAVACVQG